jgi:integrase/recombinase XerD
MEITLSTYDYCHKRLFNYIRLKGYSESNTLTVYKSILDKILVRFPEPKEVDLLQIQDFAGEFKNDNTRKNVCVVLRWLFNTVYEKNLNWYELPYPKKKKKVQPIYLKDDIFKVFEAVENTKQKTIIALIIDCGLRISEPCPILVTDCNSKERSIILRSAKGDNDRVIYPSEFVWNLIAKYWKEWDKKITDKYLFDGMEKGKPYTPESIRETLKRYCKKTNVKYLGVHAIRRFNITWQVENDVPATVVAHKVGHATSKTIEKTYLIHSNNYLRNTKSPLTFQS